MNYQNYLNSEWWKYKRENSKKSKTVQRGCLICGNKKVELHHLTYEALGEEKLNKHIIALCRRHHEEFHIWQKENNKLVGDIPDWIKEKHPKLLEKINKDQLGKCKHFTSRMAGRGKGRIKRLKKEIEKINLDFILLNKEQRKRLGPLSGLLLDKLGIPKMLYEKRVKYLIETPISKAVLFNFFDNYDAYLEEYTKIKRQRASARGDWKANYWKRPG